jgi:hypothetical protein
MVKILNSLEELYQLITGTLPEGYVEHISKAPYFIQYGIDLNFATCYFRIEDVAAHDRVKIEYGKRFQPIVTDGRIYKYV